jgi:hypothetical protein
MQVPLTGFFPARASAALRYIGSQRPLHFFDCWLIVHAASAFVKTQAHFSPAGCWHVGDPSKLPAAS